MVRYFRASGFFVFLKQTMRPTLLRCFYDWTDLGVAELIPVVETEFALKLLKRISSKAKG